MRYILNFGIGLLLIFGMSACQQSPNSPESVSKAFWDAVQTQDMEKAKEYATWDTVDYLKYLNNEKTKPQRFELGETMQGDTRAEVATMLYTQKQGESGIKVPGVTVLLKTNYGWRVNVKKTMTSVVKYTANNVFDQLNGFLQEGLQGLDKQLSNSMNELGKALEEGALELKKELSKPMYELEGENQSEDKKPLINNQLFQPPARQKI